LNQLAIDLFGPLSCRLAWRIEEQHPVYDALSRYRPEPEQVGKHRHRLGLSIEQIPVADLAVAISIGSVGKLERYEGAIIESEPAGAFIEHLLGQCLAYECWQEFM